MRSGTRPRASERGTSSPGDGVKTSTGRSSTKPRPWAVSLARVFEWEDVLEASLEETGDGDGDGDGETRRDDGDEASTSGALTRGTKDEFVVIDGANVAWGLAQKLKSRFQAKARVPMSAAVLMALDYEPWRARGIKTHAFIPKEYVIGYVNSVCDGGGLATVNAQCVEYVGKGLWCNRRLMDEVDRGRVTLVSRAGDDGRGSRKADDLTILSRAKEVFGDLAGVNDVIGDVKAVLSCCERADSGISVYIDLTEAHGYRYHSGVVFALYARELGAAIAKGGRYDGVGEVFGRKRPATGFAIDLKAWSSLAHLGQSQATCISSPVDACLGLMRKESELRTEGHVVVKAVGGEIDVRCSHQLVNRDSKWLVEPVESN